MRNKLVTIFFLAVGLAISLGGYQWIRAHIPVVKTLSDMRLDTPPPSGLEAPPLLPDDEPVMTVGIFEYQKPTLFFLLMLAGILANQIYEYASYLQSRGRRRITLKKLLKAIEGNPRFWMALSISPFIFFTTYSSIAQLPDGPVAMFYAFQNGFFWQAVFGGFRRK